MARTANCPSCGARVRFRSATSILAVCDYCQSSLLQVGEHLETIGKMAALVEDRSPLQLGTEGRYRKLGFAIIGRIQLRYEQGTWNEWYLLFDDQRTGWLSEAAGEYAVSFLQKAPERLPAFVELVPGDMHVIAGDTWVVSNIEAAECVSGEGELPFKVGPGYPAPVADLRCDRKLLTLDYSEGEGAEPLLFIGEAVPFKNLHFSHLRDLKALDESADPNTRAKALQCSHCGAPLNVSHEGVLAVGCSSCGSVVDAKTAELLSKRQDNTSRVIPLLPIGATGLLQDQQVEVIGFMQRSSQSDGVTYRWREYLLARVDTPGYLWLIEYDGHWNLAEVLSAAPTKSNARQSNFTAENQLFRHFSSYKAKVDYVEGEFTWRVKLGDVASVHDYIAPPLMFTAEYTEKEASWSRAEYLEVACIETAFKAALNGKSLPEPSGIFANQPSHRAAIHRQTCRLFWLFFLLALGVHFAILFGQRGQTFVEQAVTLEPKQAEPARSASFVLEQETPSLVVENRADVDNDWVALELTLVNQKTGEAYPASREISYYHGSDSDGSWSEGSRSDEVVFRNIPPGQYALMLEPEFDNLRQSGTTDYLRISRGTAGWGNLFLLVLLLVAFPLWTRYRMSSFESERWQESDHGEPDDD